jgi:DNA polymerase III epsilon subunit family exonuclease
MLSIDLQQLRAIAHKYLLDADRPLPSHRIARCLFGPRRHEHPEAQVVVRRLLADDPRFLETHDQRWCVQSAPHLNVRLTEATYTVVDLETTGSVIGVDEIVEIGAVVVRRGRIMDRFTSLLKIERELPPWVQRLTGIRKADLKGAPSFETISRSLSSMLADAVFVAHDIRFDLPFLRWDYMRHGLTIPPVVGLCTLCLSRQLWPDLQSRSLVDLARQFGVAHPHPHRAAADANATAVILKKELRVARQLGLTTLADLFQLDQRDRAQAGGRGPQVAAEAAE